MTEAKNFLAFDYLNIFLFQNQSKKVLNFCVTLGSGLLQLYEFAVVTVKNTKKDIDV